MKSYSAPNGGALGQSKLFLNPAEDRANHTAFWRNPNAGNIYRNTEHVNGPVTQPLLDYCGLTEQKIAALDKPIEVLDMCCGAGVVSAHIQAMLKNTGTNNKGLLNLTCADSSAAQLEHVKARIQEDGWTGTKVVLADIACLPFESNSFDFIVVGLALMAVAEPYAGLSELFRVLKPGGRLASSTWAVEGWVPATCEALASLSLPGQKAVPWPQQSGHVTRNWSPGAWDDDYFTAAMYNASGFTGIKAEIFARNVFFKDAEQFCTTLEGLHYGLMEKYWSKEQREKLRPRLKELFTEYLEKKYNGGPFEFERSVVLATATKPLV